MTQDTKPLTANELTHLREIRVCCCEPGCTVGPHCVAPVLDGIGADWINDHFDSILATIDQQAAEIERLRTESDRRQREYGSAVDTVVQECMRSRSWESGKQAAYLRDALLTHFDPLMIVTQRLNNAAKEPK